MGIKSVFDRPHAGGCGALDLVADIDGARRIVADKHDGQRRWPADNGRQLGDALGDALDQFFGKDLAVDQGGVSHVMSSGEKEM